MTKRAVVLTLGVILLLALTVVDAFAIVVCHDYTYYRLTGKDPRPAVKKKGHGISAATLRNYLKKNGYRMFPYTNAARTPSAGRRLKAGDVVIIDSAHSGYVVGGDRIDHFIQVFGKSGTMYDAGKLPLHQPGKAGGLYKGDSLKQFLDRRFKKSFTKIEVWRKR